MRFIVFIFLFSIASGAVAQVPAKCLEIESILVDACVPGSGCTSSASPSCSCEGKNEMIRFRVGGSPVLLADIFIDWPNNSFLGIHLPDATTNGIVATLNGTIVSPCGELLQPTGGILPAGAKVLLISSTEMCTTANSFADLTDTLYVIFQNAGNFQGHFANHNNSGTATAAPTGGVSLRTTVMGVTSAACFDTVTYDRQFLVNTLGTYGGSTALNDGSRVDFSWPGAPLATYVNQGCMAPFSPVSVSASAAPTVCANDTLAVSAVVSGDVTTIAWSGGAGSFINGASLNAFYVPGAGESGTVQLYITVSDACGSPVSDSLSITISPGPVVNITADGPLTFCAGGDVVLTGVSAFPVSWSVPSSGASITVTTSGVYTATVSNACGTGTDAVTVTVNPLPAVSVTAVPPVCENLPPFMLSGSPAGGTWSGTGVTSAGMFNPAASTGAVNLTYSYTDANGCTATAPLTINVSPAPVISITPVPALCSGSAPVNINATPAGGTWTGTGVSPSGVFTAATAGIGSHTLTYQVTSGACTVSGTITVSVTAGAAVSIVPVAPLCQTSGVTALSGSPAGGTWTGTGMSASGVFNPSVAGSGLHMIVYTAGTGACAGADTITIQVDPVPAIVIVPVDSLCTTDAPVTVSVTPAGGTWTGTGMSPTGTFTPAGLAPGIYTSTYTVTVGACTAQNNLSITVGTPANLVISAGGPLTFCEGNSVQLSVTGHGGNTVTWSNGATGNTITVTQPGNYFATAASACGTSTSATLTVTVNTVNPSFTVTPPEGIYPLEVAIVNTTPNTLGYTWYISDSIYAVNTDTVINYDQPGTYTIQLYVVSQDGCIDSISQTVVVYAEYGIVIPNVFTPNGDGTNDVFSIVGTGIESLEALVYNRWGQQLQSYSNMHVTDGTLTLWDGKTSQGNTVANGAYAYILNVTGVNGNTQTYKGFVTVIAK